MKTIRLTVLDMHSVTRIVTNADHPTTYLAGMDKPNFPLPTVERATVELEPSIPAIYVTLWDNDILAKEQWSWYLGKSYGSHWRRSY